MKIKNMERYLVGTAFSVGVGEEVKSVFDDHTLPAPSPRLWFHYSDAEKVTANFHAILIKKVPALSNGLAYLNILNHSVNSIAMLTYVFISFKTAFES